MLPEVKASGKTTREQHLEWWLDRFAGRTLAEITSDLVAEARDELASGTFTRGKEQIDKKTGAVIAPKQYRRSGATVNRYIATLSHLFSMAVKEWRLTSINPVRDVSKKKETRGRVRFLTDEERDALLAACKQSEWSELHALVLLAITTGARRGELIKLKWSDVNLKKSRAIVHDTKNGDSRSLPIVGSAQEALRQLKLQNSARSDFVFPQPSGFPAEEDARAALDNPEVAIRPGPHEHFDAH